MPRLVKSIFLIYFYQFKTLNSYQGGTCGVQIDEVWATDVCGEPYKYGIACEKMKGNQCPDGWTYHKSASGENCYFFVLNGRNFKDFLSADHHCTSIGANLMEINDEQEQFFVAR